MSELALQLIEKEKKERTGVTRATKHMTEDDIKQELKQARRDYRKAKRDHASLREKFLDTLSPKARDHLKRTEAQRKLAYASKKVTGKLESKGVTSMEHGNRVCVSKTDIDSVLLQVNRDKLLKTLRSSNNHS